MTIECDEFDNFMLVIAWLLQRGIGFAAEQSTYTITLTGSH